MIRRMLLLLVFPLAMGHAQTAGEPEKPKLPPRSLRLLPLGEPPPFRQDIRDGVRYELEPAAGSIPPRQVRLGEGESPTLIRLNLGRATEPVKIPGGTVPAILREAKAVVDPATKPWLTLRPPETGDVLALIWRAPGTQWDKPQCLILPDSAAAFPAGSIRIVNLLPVETALLIGAERVLLGPARSLVKAIAIGTDLPLQIAFKNNLGQYQRFYSGAVLLNPNERAQIFTHRADGEKPRQPAKVVVFSEAAPPPPKPQP